MPTPQRIEMGKQLLVEGNDQRHFFEAVTAHLGIAGIQVQNFGGVSELGAFVRAFSNVSGFRETVTSLGIVRDAEIDAAAAFRSVQSALRNAHLPVPETVGVQIGDAPVVAAFLLPGDGQTGMLETLLCRTFEASPEASCIDDYFRCVEVLPGTSIDRPDKARAQAWLATRPDPHLSVGIAAKRGYWDLDHGALGTVREFLMAM